MYQLQRAYVAGALLGFAAAPILAVAADTATDSSTQQPAIPYRAEQATEKFTSDASKVTLEMKSDGSRVYHLNGEGMQSVVAHIGADGKLAVECTDDVEKALHSTAVAENAHEK